MLYPGFELLKLNLSGINLNPLSWMIHIYSHFTQKLISEKATAWLSLIFYTWEIGICFNFPLNKINIIKHYSLRNDLVLPTQYLSYVIRFSHMLNILNITKILSWTFFLIFPYCFFFLNSYSFKLQVPVFLRIHLMTILCTYI